MATKKPTEILFTPFTYKINWTKSKGASTHGESNLELKEITINPVGNAETVAETLVHESSHVLVEDLIHMLLNTDLKEEDAEELFIRLFSPRLYSFIRYNRDVTDFIQKDNDE